MHPHRTGATAASARQPAYISTWSHRVRGLGICDVLELSLDRHQLPHLYEALDDRRIAHEQAIADAIALASSGRMSNRDRDDDVEHHRTELAILRAIGEQTKSSGPRRMTIRGPAPQVSAITYGATVCASQALFTLAVDAATSRSTALARHLTQLAHVAHLWSQTLHDLVELEWSSFDATPD